MAFIVRIAVVCLLLAAIPCIAAADDSGDHDFGNDADAVSGADDASGNSPDDSGDRDCGSAGSDHTAEHSPDESGISVSDSSVSGSADRADTPGAENSGGEGISSGSEPASPAGTGHRYEEVTSGSSGDTHRAEERSGTSRDTEESGAGSAERDMYRPDPRDGSEHSDIHVSVLSRENRVSTVHRESDTDLREGARRDSSPKTTPEDADEWKSGRDTRGMRSEIPDSGGIFTGIAGTASDDSWMPPGSSPDTSVTVPETSGHRTSPGEREHEGERPAFPLPEDVPGSRAPFADSPALPASGLPLGTASGAVAGSGTPVRMKSKDEQEPIWHPMDSSMVLNPWMLLRLWCFLGFRRVLRKNVLESNERRSLYETIMQYPGADLSRLTEMLRLNKETARYHLKMLAQNGKISGLIKQGIARYFPCRETISDFEKTVIHYLWIATTKRILLLLIESPGVTRQAIARELGIAGPSVTWQMQRLADDGLIEVRSEGRFVKYFLTPDSAGILGTVTIPDHRGGPVAT